MRRHAASLVLLAGAACGGGGGPKVALRYHPPTGAVYHYGIEQHTGLSAESGPLARMGKRNMLMRVYFTQTVKGPTSGGTEIEVLFESVTMEMPGVPASVTGGALARLQGMRATAVIDEQGKVTRSEFVNAPAGLSPDVTKRITGGINAAIFGFPQQPVGRGDSWSLTSKLPLDQIPGMTASTTEVARTTLTVREIRIAGSDTSVVLDIKTEFPAEPIRLASAEGSGTLKLEGGMSGHQVFSLSRGAIVDGTLKGTMKMRFTGSGLPAGGMSMQTENDNSIVLLPN